jgi:hypothetical protein
MHAKWKFGFVVLLVPNLLDAAAALARLRQQSLRLPAPLQMAIRPQIIQILQRFNTPSARGIEPSDSWDKVSPYKKKAFTEIFAAANTLRAAERQLALEKEQLRHLMISWAIPQEIRDKLTSDEPRTREEGKVTLRNHFIVLDTRAKNPPK